MSCFVVTLSITYKLKPQFTQIPITTDVHTSPCLAGPFSLEYDPSVDGFFLDYAGGRWFAEGGWVNYDILSSSIISQVPCTGCTIPAYDCVNGSCVISTHYSTPGIYDSIDSCNLSCGGPTCAAGLSCLDPNSLVCPVCPTCPTCPECPDCPDSEGICPPCGPCPTASTCPTGQTCQLPTGEDVNFVNIAAPIFLGTCDDSGNPVMGTRQVRVIEGTETSESLKFQDLAQIQGAAVCKVDVAATPDGWLIRPEWHRPQVIYQFAQIDNSGKIVGAPKYKITVPHHLSDQPDDPLPNYKRGNWEIIYVLKDNSKVTIHSFNETTGMNLLDSIKLRIIPSYLDGSYLSKSGLVVTDTSIAEITVKNRMAKYYSTGTKNDLPDWIAKW